MKPEEILVSLKQHKEAILSQLDRGNHFNSYLFIQKKFKDLSIDNDFKARFCQFYILNGSTGLNVAQKKVFRTLNTAQK